MGIGAASKESDSSLVDERVYGNALDILDALPIALKKDGIISANFMSKPGSDRSSSPDRAVIVRPIGEVGFLNNLWAFFRVGIVGRYEIQRLLYIVRRLESNSPNGR